MKVLHLISGGDSGGAKTHVLSLLQDLNKSISADLVCYMEGPFAEEARQRKIPTTVFDGSFSASLRKTAEKLRSGDYELVHCHGSRANLMGALLKRRFDIPFISTVHSDYKLDYLGRPLADLTYGRLNSYALHRMDYRVCVSDEMRDTLISRGFAPNEMFAIYNGVDFDVEPARVDRAEWLEKIGCGFAPEDVIVGIAARMDPVKDVATTVRGFAKASEKCENLRLLIAGDGQEREMLETLASDLGVREKVFFAGWLRGMEGYYSSVDINVISSISETFPYAVTEAARAKLPTAASRVGGLPKLLVHGETGMIFEAGDSDALAKELLELANDSELRKKMGEAVYEKAKNEFSAASTCRRQLEIYETVLRREEKRRAGVRDSVVICGAYGHGNAGDEAILSGMIHQLRSLDRERQITVISRSPKDTQIFHGVNAIGRGKPLRQDKAFKSAKLYINGGGSLIQDVTSRRSLWFYLYTLRRAKKLGCKVQMFGCGIGPLMFNTDRRMSASVLNRYVDALTLRDPDSLALLKEIGVTEPEIILAADPVLSVPACDEKLTEKFMAENGLKPDGHYLCLGLRDWAGFDEKVPAIADSLRYAYKELGLTPVFLSMNYAKDYPTSKQVAEAAQLPCVMLPEITEPGLAIGVMSKMKLVMAMRLHSLLFAANSGVPSVGISYDPKVSSFVEYTGCGKCLELEELTADALKSTMAQICAADNKTEFEKSLKKVREAEGLNLLTAKRLMNLE